MPRRARPGNRLAIEAGLSAEQLSGLRSLCSALGVPHDRWQTLPYLQAAFETAAAARLAQRIERDEGKSRKAAVLEAAFRLGLNPATITTRLERAPRDAWSRCHYEG